MIPLPCPFCGSTNITAQRGSTFRWWYAGCCECGAQAGEVRRQTLGDGTNEEWDAKAADDAIKEWNTRAPAALAPQPQEDHALLAKRLALQPQEPVAWRPALKGDDPLYRSRSWNDGAPTSSDVDYWTRHGQGIEYAYAAQPVAVQPSTRQESGSST